MSEPFDTVNAAFAELMRRHLPDFQFGIASFPKDEVFNPGGAQAFVARGELGSGLYAHGEAATPEFAIITALVRALAETVKTAPDTNGGRA